MIQAVGYAMSVLENWSIGGHEYAGFTDAIAPKKRLFSTNAARYSILS